MEEYRAHGAYVHDGSLATLAEVIDHYATGGKLDHPNKLRILHPLPMTDGDKRDLIEFLKSLRRGTASIRGMG